MNRRRTYPLWVIAALAVALAIGVANYSLAAPAVHHPRHHKPTLTQLVAKAVASYLRTHRGQYIGPRGPKGGQGAPGVPGTATAYAAVSATLGPPTLIPSLSKNFLSVTRASGDPAGVFCLQPSISLSSPPVATIRIYTFNSPYSIRAQEESVAGGTCPQGSYEVDTFAESVTAGLFIETRSDVDFTIVVP
jgi:hypothetical protein